MQASAIKNDKAQKKKYDEPIRGKNNNNYRDLPRRLDGARRAVSHRDVG